MQIAIVICLAVLFCSLTVYLCRCYVQKTFSEIDEILDGVLRKNPKQVTATQAESRLSKLAHKARKVIRINNADAVQTTQEKKIIQEFISDMSHQMKTPLSGISMYTDLLIEGNLSKEEQQEFLERMKVGVNKLQWLMDSLVKMSRLEVGAIELAPEPLGIKQTISDSIALTLPEAAKKNIDIETDYFDDILLLHDRKWTVEAMTNILNNAVKYGSADNKIHIAIETLPTYTKINITDYGIGIAQEEYNSIFKRFYRGENAKEFSGSGLGLYLSSLILEKQGGYILVDSERGKYTTFSLFLQNC